MITRYNHKISHSLLPDEFLYEIIETFNSQYKNNLDLLEKEVFNANALIYPNEILLVVTLSKPGKVKSFNIYASIDYTKEKTSINNAVYHLVDSIGFFLEEYFASQRQITLSEDWVGYEINNKKVYLRGDSINLALEQIAKKILVEKN